MRNRLVSQKTKFVTTCHLALLALATSGCGLLGDKDPASKLLQVEQKNSGCLDRLGPLMEQYIDGTVAESEWDQAFVCLDDTLDMFVKFVKGSDAAGYTREDVKALTERFILTNKPITRNFVEGIFEVKASLFGGNNRVLSREQVAEFRNLLVFLNRETKVLIPHLYNRKHNPRKAELRAMMAAIDEFGVKFADYLNTGNNPSLSRDSAVMFVKELTKISFPKLTPEEMEQWTDTLLATKHALIRGEENGISGYDWKELFRFGIRMGSVVLGYASTVDNDPLFEVEIAEAGQKILNESVNTWNGAIPLAAFERIVRNVPDSVIKKFSDRVSDTRAATRALFMPRMNCPNFNEEPIVDGKCRDVNGNDVGTPTPMKPAASRFLGSKKDDALDAGAFQNFIDVWKAGKRADFHLAAIYGSTREELTPTQFGTRADEYLKANGGNANIAVAADIARIKRVATRYPGLHREWADEIIFSNWSTHSRNNLSKMSWYEAAAEKILKAYGSKVISGLGNAGTISDLFALVQDINPLLLSMSMVHPDKRKVYAKRFREANTFMPASNGDDNMDLLETTNYFAFFFSSSKVAGNISKKFFKSEDGKTGLCNKVGEDPILQIPTFDIQCVRREMQANYLDVFHTYPIWIADYEKLSTKDQTRFWKLVESASKPFGYDENPLSDFDLSSYSGIQHFTEAVMFKYDRRDGKADGKLDWKEINDYLFPVFKRELASLTNINIGIVNRAILIWLAQHGTSPFKCGVPKLNTWAGWKEILNIISWLGRLGPLAPIDAPRMRIYEIFETLSNMGLPNQPGCKSSSSSSFDILDQVSETAGSEWLKQQPEYKQALENYPQDQ